MPMKSRQKDTARTLGRLLLLTIVVNIYEVLFFVLYYYTCCANVRLLLIAIGVSRCAAYGEILPA